MNIVVLAETCVHMLVHTCASTPASVQSAKTCQQQRNSPSGQLHLDFPLYCWELAVGGIGRSCSFENPVFAPNSCPFMLMR
jgi:hypothetical protein